MDSLRQINISFLAVLLWTGLLAGAGAVGLHAQPNFIQTGVPFLTIGPDARVSALGNAGVAVPDNNNAQHWNPAGYSFSGNTWGTSLSCGPWQKELFDNTILYYLTGFWNYDERNSFSGSLRYFGSDRLIFTSSASPQGIMVPGEYAIDLGYSRRVRDRLAMGFVLRYIHSDLSGRTLSFGIETRAAQALAGDVGLLYRNPDIMLGKMNAVLGLGAHVSNVGNKIAYTETSERAFLPANLRLGGAFSLQMNNNHSLSLMADLNKLLVPTPPEYATNPGGFMIIPSVISHGKDPDVPVIRGIFQSFWDAPGVILEDGSRSRLLEELHEITISGGIEYRYRESLAARAGYFFEHETKGPRRYFSLGAGFSHSFLSLDASYVIAGQKSPISKTFRITLSVSFS